MKLSVDQKLKRQQATVSNKISIILKKMPKSASKQAALYELFAYDNEANKYLCKQNGCSEKIIVSK